jgi:hypothetical protein
MQKTLALLLLLLITSFARAGELPVSTKQPLVVVAPDQWTSGVEQPPNGFLPIETYHVLPPAGHNASCLISIVGRDKQQYTDPQLLKNLVRSGSLPYVSSPEELPKLEPKELLINGGLGFYLNFVDPDLVGKPIEAGKYKTATPITVSLGTKYLMNITILCDDLNGPDYRDMLKIVQSIKVKGSL